MTPLELAQEALTRNDAPHIAARYWPTTARALATSLLLAEAALRAVHDWRGLCDANDIETFERIAAMFRQDTGFLRPGKDYAAASGGCDEEERREAWSRWVERKNDDLDAQIRAALGSTPSRPGS